MVDPVRTSAIVLAASDVNDAIIHIGPKLAVALVLLTAIAAVVNHLSGSGMAAGAVRAVLRAIAQLGALALVVTVVIDVLWASILFVLVMAAVAACTSAGRVTGKPGVIRRETVNTALLCLIPVGLPTLVIVALLVATGVLPMTGLAIIPTAGIMFGAAMNTTSLAGKHCLDSLAERYGEVEAAMSLGFSSGRRVWRYAGTPHRPRSSPPRPDPVGRSGHHSRIVRRHGPGRRISRGRGGDATVRAGRAARGQCDRLGPDRRVHRPRAAGAAGAGALSHPSWPVR